MYKQGVPNLYPVEDVPGLIPRRGAFNLEARTQVQAAMSKTAGKLFGGFITNEINIKHIGRLNVTISQVVF